jgi:hypothetical protein
MTVQYVWSPSKVVIGLGHIRNGCVSIILIQSEPNANIIIVVPVGTISNLNILMEQSYHALCVEGILIKTMNTPYNQQKIQ